MDLVDDEDAILPLEDTLAQNCNLDVRAALGDSHVLESNLLIDFCHLLHHWLLYLYLMILVVLFILIVIVFFCLQIIVLMSVCLFFTLRF